MGAPVVVKVGGNISLSQTVEMIMENWSGCSRRGYILYHKNSRPFEDEVDNENLKVHLQAHVVAHPSLKSTVGGKPV